MHPNSTHLTAPEQIRRAVVFNGTSAIAKGQAFTYQRAFTGTRQADGTTIGAATVAWERDKYVQKPVPSSTYEQWFAGVAEQDYPATSGDAFREITLLEPGSYCQIATLIPTTVGVTRLTALASAAGAVYTAGKFVAGRYRGRGSAVAMQTLAALASTTDYNVGVFSNSLDGTASIAISGTAYTLTKTAAFAYVPTTANLQGNEYVHIVAGATAASGAAQITPGRYKITAKTSDDVVVLDPAGTAPAASTCDCNFYCVRGNPLVWARLDDGAESGLVEWINTNTDGSGTTAVPGMVGGYSFIFGGITLSNGNAIDTLANGTYIGQRKAYYLSGTLTTSSYVVTVTAGLGPKPGGSNFDGWQDCNTLTFTTDADYCNMEWDGTNWVVTSKSGTVTS